MNSSFREVEHSALAINLKYQEITGFVQKTSLLKPPSPRLAPYPQAWDTLPEKQLSEITK